MARKTKNPPSETDVLLTNYIDQTLGNTGKIGWSSEEVSGMVGFFSLFPLAFRKFHRKLLRKSN